MIKVTLGCAFMHLAHGFDVPVSNEKQSTTIDTHITFGCNIAIDADDHQAAATDTILVHPQAVKHNTTARAWLALFDVESFSQYECLLLLLYSFQISTHM